MYYKHYIKKKKNPKALNFSAEFVCKISKQCEFRDISYFMEIILRLNVVFNQTVVVDVYNVNRPIDKKEGPNFDSFLFTVPKFLSSEHFRDLRTENFVGEI